jgi:hypothetical protein
MLHLGVLRYQLRDSILSVVRVRSLHWLSKTLTITLLLDQVALKTSHRSVNLNQFPSGTE